MPPSTSISTQWLHLLPSVERVLQQLGAQAEFQSFSHGKQREILRDMVRATLADLRQQLRLMEDEPTPEYLWQTITGRVRAGLQQRQRPSLLPVINATGVVLHTNLGRAPLAPAALAAVAEVAGAYTNLEYDLEEGKRGHRHVHCETLLKELLGSEAAVVVNNCAAAVLLILDTFCQGGEVLLSRGELIEIGGGFRIPEVLRKSGATLREVGTTNKTRLADYREALSPNTKMILRVHPSNFRLIGFSQSPSREELVGLARETGILTCEDVGSGALVDLTGCGFAEPMAKDAIAAGFDLVAFSGDKLLGGPQAGIIAGRRTALDEIRRNHLLRALRVDKLTYAALEATLRVYADGQAFEQVPALAALSLSPRELASRANSLRNRLRVRFRKLGIHCETELMKGFSLVGGGSAPQAQLPTTLVGLQPAEFSAAELETRLRAANPPVIVRVENDHVWLDLRTVLPGQERPLLETICTVF
ncbi:MAG: L-seryl-tRNA(Sec) selenium transferase [Blastocatellia bacterium]|nr:L-seryl-tRNA(Sec) selenium transferase [Blastocatellia bacterium]